MNKLTIYTIRENSKSSRILDLIRFISSLVVFLFHFYVPLPGYQAVMIFFVLSGYFISSSVLKLISENKWRWGDYLLKRLIRLWIVLIPSLILTLFWAKIQFSLFGETKLSNYLEWKIFIGNLFFLQGITTTEYGLNGPLWSLSYEFWYYIMFPCLVLFIYTPKRGMKVCYAAIIILISIFVGLKITEYFFVWLLGAIIPIVRPIKIKRKVISNFIILFCTLLVLVSMKAYVVFVNYPNLQIIPDLCIGISFSILLYFIVSLFNNNADKIKVNIPKHLSSFSYTLYLTHFPLAHIILTWRASKSWTFTGKEALIMKFIIMVLVILYAWFIALLTEKHTERVRKVIFGFIKAFGNKKVKSLIANKFQ
jgi:peptidoglycan/LPS O-acetylase OafA/YrhL